MELPKNITQIGEADRTCKVYVEDYVVSYMKQLCRQAEGKGLTIALYGRYAREQSLSYFFIYGACQILSISKEVRHLSQAQNQEVERLRQRYFPEYVFLGYHIFDGEMVEGMHIQEQDTCRYIKGYACFYEKNDSMLAYMVENKPQEHEPEQFGQEKYDRARAKQEERRSQYGQKKTPAAHTKIASDKPEKQTGKNVQNVQNVAQSSSLKMMRMSAAAVFAVLCLIGVAAVTRDGEDGTIEERAKQLWAQLTDDQPETDASAPEDAAGEIHNSGTLMAENSLADAILQENRDATAVSGQAVAGQPQQNEENEQGETGAGQNTGESGIGQNAGESGPGQAQNTGQESGQTQNAGQGSGPEQENGQGNRPEQGAISGQDNGQSQGDGTGSEQGSGQGQEEGQGQEAGQNQGGQSVESLNPGAGPGENAADAQPQEIPTQGPSIAEIEAQQASYVIQPGDTLIGISTRQYGNDSYVRAICELNGISNPDNIQVGQKILLP